MKSWSGQVVLACPLTDFPVLISLDSDAATPYDITGAGLFENYALGAVDGSGLLLPAVDDNA